MNPIIKLFHDEDRFQWICGNEDGNFVIATDEFIADVHESVFSKRLKVMFIESDAARWYVPIKTDDFFSDMARESSPGGDEEVIELDKYVVANRYVIRAGFGRKTMTYVCHKDFYILEDDS